LWKCVIDNHIDLPPLKMSCPPLASPLKKAGAATGRHTVWGWGGSTCLNGTTPLQ